MLTARGKKLYEGLNKHIEPYINLYEKLKEKEPPLKKEEPKPTPPNTRATVEAGVKQSDKNLSRREIIRQEYQKLK